MLAVTLNESATRFVATGGDPKGKDHVHSVVSTWPGWARVAAAAGRSAGSVFAGPLSITSALALSSTQLDLSWGEEARARVGELLSMFRAARAALDGTSAPRFTPRTKRQPKPYQFSGVAAMDLLDGRALLADDMGLGKSAQALWLAQTIHERTTAGDPTSTALRRVLVLSPASVKFNWQREVDATLGTWPTQVINGSGAKRANQFAEARASFVAHNKLVLVINYDLLRYLNEEQVLALRKFADGQMVIGDEFHNLKNPSADRSKFVREHLMPSEGGARWRVGITGTPQRNTVEDFYHQCELLMPGLFHSFRWFQNRYCVQSTLKVGKKKRVTKRITRGAKNLDELNGILNTFMIRRRKEDVSDLPPKVYTYPELELDKDSARIYAAMRDYALLQLDEHDDDESVLSLSARSAVEAAARCEQIAQGCVGGIPEEVLPKLSNVIGKSAESVEGKPGWLVFPRSAKMAWLLEQLETVRLQGGSSVVFSRFNAPLLWLEQNREGVAVYGDIENEKRDEIFDAFQAGDIPELYVQVRIAEGFNLHRAQDEFFLGRDWAPSVNEQAVDRCHRIGQKGTVNVQMPFMRRTIEQRQHKALLAKQDTADTALVFRTIKDLKDALA